MPPLVEDEPAPLSEQDQLVYTHYEDNKYRLYIARTDEFMEEPVNPFLLDYEAATLPPAQRTGINIVDNMLLRQPELVRDTKGDFKPVPYRPKFKLDYISNTSVGVAAGRLGTGMAGSISAIFSDMVGDNQIYANLALNGEIYDFGGQVALHTDVADHGFEPPVAFAGGLSMKDFAVQAVDVG